LIDRNSLTVGQIHKRVFHEDGRSNDTIDKLSTNSEHMPASAKQVTIFHHIVQGSKKRFFFKKPNPVGFIGFLDKQEKIGKIIQKLSNLKP